MEFSMEYWNFPWKLPRSQMEDSKRGRFILALIALFCRFFSYYPVLDEIGEVRVHRIFQRRLKWK